MGIHQVNFGMLLKEGGMNVVIEEKDSERDESPNLMFDDIQKK